MSDWLDELPFAAENIPRGGTGPVWREEVEAYLAHPGKWRRLTTFKGHRAKEKASNLVSGINRKYLASFRTTGHWQTARKYVSDSEVEIWVRWLDTADPAPGSTLVTRPRRKRTTK